MIKQKCTIVTRNKPIRQAYLHFRDAELRHSGAILSIKGTNKSSCISGLIFVLVSALPALWWLLAKIIPTSTCVSNIHMHTYPLVLSVKNEWGFKNRIEVISRTFVGSTEWSDRTRTSGNFVWSSRNHIILNFCHFSNANVWWYHNCCNL